MYQLLLMCMRNQMAVCTRKILWRSPMMSWRVIFTFCRISDFLRQFYAFFKIFAHFQMAKKRGNLDRRLFPASPRVRVDFILQKKNYRKVILGAKTCLYGNSHILFMQHSYEWKQCVIIKHKAER